MKKGVLDIREIVFIAITLMFVGALWMVYKGALVDVIQNAFLEAIQ